MPDPPAINQIIDQDTSLPQTTSILRGIKLCPQVNIGEWCAVGCVVGYFMNGIAKPSTSASAFVVITARYIQSQEVTFDIAFQGLFPVKLGKNYNVIGIYSLRSAPVLSMSSPPLVRVRVSAFLLILVIDPCPLIHRC